MEFSKPCEYCGEKKAAATCNVCGAAVCPEHDRDHGCAVCKGRMELG